MQAIITVPGNPFVVDRDDPNRHDKVMEFVASLGLGLVLVADISHLVMSCGPRAGAATVLVKTAAPHRLEDGTIVDLSGTGYDNRWTVALNDVAGLTAPNEFVINGPFTTPTTGGRWDSPA